MPVQAINGRCLKMWLSNCVGVNSRETPYSPICLAIVLLIFPFLTLYKKRNSYVP